MSEHRIVQFLVLITAGTAAGGNSQARPVASLIKPAWIAAQPFTDVSSIQVLRTGAVLIADFNDQSLYLLDQFGQSIRKLGRKGSGPNEYLTPLRLLSMPGDSTWLLDRDSHRFLVIAPTGQLVGTIPFASQLEAGGEFVRGGDQRGRLYFQNGFLARSSTAAALPVYRWDRSGRQPDSIASIMVPNPQPIERNIPGVGKVVGRRLMPFTPQDDWVVAPSGRVVFIRPSPYRVDWRELDGTLTVGPAVTYAAVPVTDADRKAREPNGPPFQLVYPTTKTSFTQGTAVIDDREQVWVRREGRAGAAEFTWDIFDGKGKHLGVLDLPASKRIVAITSRFVYVVRTDEDDLQWLEAYSH